MATELLSSSPLNLRKILRIIGILCVVLFGIVPSANAATGVFKLKSTEVNEVSGAWHLYVSISLPKAPLTAHQSMKFLFTKEVVYERSLVDNQKDPVINRQVLQNQTPSVENLEVDFANASGKIFANTRFDFGLTRTRGYEAGEYKVELRTSDGVTIGGTARLVLKGDNPVVDRRAIAFSAKDKGIKKIEGYDAGANQAKNDDVAPVNNGPSEVTPTGTATGFVPKEGFNETEEEKIKTRPKGCGCEVPGNGGPSTALFFLLPIVGIGLIAIRRRSSRV